MIKWLVTLGAVQENVRLDNQHVYYFAKYMYPEVTEPTFIKAFLKKLNLNLWINYHDMPEMLEYFLCHLRRNGGTFKDNTERCEPIELSIRNLRFLNIASILKFQDAPRVPSVDTVWFIYNRLFGISPTASAAECLRLLWNSLPDAFFSFEEIEMALQAGLSYNFYSGAVGVFQARVELRSLKHLCRPTVRRMLWESGCWIPDGIRLTGVPRHFQSFLNLEA
ncbi:hypothetical protein AVEN_33394-1 [Araneus ventricosus]|uniref:SOCS box domain-containing protein n=1 Tax=Araneus ventricosus TaxID=182803 RepID=A0A4Y2MHN9_ARAVE|nr:hypothetical protein AVEN_33394-1 [Araneus ventricosus]